MAARHYYNDHDPKAAAWLRELIRAGEIPDGEVDERSILDVRPEDLRGFRQCHFFAGIGGWPLALRLAGVPEDAPVWTGSPPCQPFSVAGLARGREDERHLAPHFLSLVGACRPGLLFGEQVASAEVFGKATGRVGRNYSGPPQWAWLDDLCDRLEAARYTAGASDIPAAGIGAPHIRQRTFFGAVSEEWLADSTCEQHDWSGAGGAGRGPEHPDGGNDGGMADRDGDGCGQAGCGQPEAGGHGSFGDGATRGLGNGFGAGLEGHGGNGNHGDQPGRLGSIKDGSAAATGPAGGVADADRWQRDRVADGERCQRDRAATERHEGHGLSAAGGQSCIEHNRPGPLHGFWADADWLLCRDERWRPVEPGTFPLADGIPGRVGLLRGYGNAIVPQAAAEFIAAFLTACMLQFGRSI